MKFNERLLELRKKNGWSQEELGYKLDVSRQTISKWESGQTTPELEKLRTLSKIFDISVDELINEEDIVKKENVEKEKKISNKTNSKTFKYIKGVLNLILISIIIIYVIIIFKRVVIIRNVEKILFETVNEYKYMDIQKSEYKDTDEVFPSKYITKTFQIYDKDNKHFAKSEIRDGFSEKHESADYYDEYNKEKDEWKYMKIDYLNKTYYLNKFDQPFEHNYALHFIKLFQEYQKNYNYNIERLDINDFIMAMNLKIRISEVDNVLSKGYVITNRKDMYQNYCEILVDTRAETICLEKIIYNEETKDFKIIEKYRYIYNDDYVMLEEIQPPDLTEYTLTEYVEE